MSLFSCPRYGHFWGVGAEWDPSEVRRIWWNKTLPRQYQHSLHMPFTLLASFHPTTPPYPNNMPFPHIYLPPPPSSCPYQHPPNRPGVLYTFPAPQPQLLDSTDNRVPSSIPSRQTHRGGRKRGTSLQFTLNPHSSQEEKALSNIPKAEEIKPSRGLSWKVNVPLWGKACCTAPACSKYSLLS